MQGRERKRERERERAEKKRGTEGEIVIKGKCPEADAQLVQQVRGGKEKLGIKGDHDEA